MDVNDRRNTILCLGSDELLHVAGKLDGMSLARLECVSRRFRDSVRIMEDLWSERCSQLLASSAFNPSGIRSVSPQALYDYLGLTSARQLYVALIHLPCAPVGIWYRTDAAAQPEGELVSIYAAGRGVYKMSPLDHSGGVLKQIELMRTDLCATTYEMFQDCSADRTDAAPSTPQRSAAQRSGAGVRTAGDHLHALTTTAQLFASAVPTVEPHLVPYIASVPSTAQGSTSSHGAAPMGTDCALGAQSSATLRDFSAQHAAHIAQQQHGATGHREAGHREEDAADAGVGPSEAGPLAAPLVAWKAERVSCVLRYIGDRCRGGALSPQLAASAARAMRARLRTQVEKLPDAHPPRSRILWPATLLPADFPVQHAQHAQQSGQGPSAGPGPGPAGRGPGAAAGAAAGASGGGRKRTAHMEDLAVPGPSGMHVRMVVPKRSSAQKLDIRTTLEWARSDAIQDLHRHIAASPHLSHISPQRSFFMGTWETVPPDFQPCMGDCAARPPSLACIKHTGREAQVNAAQRRCPDAPADFPNRTGVPQSPLSHPLGSFGSSEVDAVTANQLTSTLSGTRLEAVAHAGTRAAANVRLPEHEVVQVSLRRLQMPPRQMLQRERLPRLQAALRTLRGLHALTGVDICDVLCGMWQGLYPGHGHEVVQLSVVRAHSGLASLPADLHSCYLQQGPHPWPVSPSANQVHVMKLRGDRNVPARQCTLAADLSRWSWGPLNWQQFTLPICYVREVRGDNLDMEIWQHEQKTVLGSCPAWCQINKWPGTWNPEWVDALLILLADGDSLCLADLVNLGRFPHLVEFRPVYIAEADEPGWLPAAQHAAHAADSGG